MKFNITYIHLYTKFSNTKYKTIFHLHIIQDIVSVKYAVKMVLRFLSSASCKHCIIRFLKKMSVILQGLNLRLATAHR